MIDQEVEFIESQKYVPSSFDHDAELKKKLHFLIPQNKISTYLNALIYISPLIQDF